MNDHLLEKIRKAIDELVSSNFRYLEIWNEDILFKWHWWLQVFLMIVPIILWLIFRDKKSTDRLLYAGFFVLLISSWLDFAGNSFGLWYYPSKLLPTLPPYVPWETFIAVQVMFLLQFKPTMSPIKKAVGLALFNSFVGEPIVDWLGIYERVHWEYIYSFPIYIVIYFVAHYLSRRKHFHDLK